MSSRNPSDDDTRVEPCAVCGDERPLNGELDGAIEHGGQVLCGDCTDTPVVFEAHCELWSCEWTHRVEGREFNRYAVRQCIQQEANNHETEHRVLRDDPFHEAVWEEVSDAN